MQSPDYVSGLHITVSKFFQPSSCLDEAMLTWENVLYCLNRSRKETLRIESKKCGKMRALWVRKNLVYIDIVVLRQRCSANNIVTCLCLFLFLFLFFVCFFVFFSWIRRDDTRKGNNPSKQHYSPVIHQRFRGSKIQVVMLQATRPSKQSSFKLSCNKVRENGKLRINEPTNSSFSKLALKVLSSNSNVWCS